MAQGPIYCVAVSNIPCPPKHLLLEDLGDVAGEVEHDLGVHHVELPDEGRVGLRRARHHHEVQWTWTGPEWRCPRAMDGGRDSRTEDARPQAGGLSAARPVLPPAAAHNEAMGYNPVGEYPHGARTVSDILVAAPKTG